MKTPPIAEEILRLQKEIITFGMGKLRSSNIEKKRKLEELLKKLNEDEKV